MFLVLQCPESSKGNLGHMVFMASQESRKSAQTLENPGYMVAAWVSPHLKFGFTPARVRAVPAHHVEGAGLRAQLLNRSEVGKLGFYEDHWKVILPTEFGKCWKKGVGGVPLRNSCSL